MNITSDPADARPSRCVFIVERDQVVRSALGFILKHHRRVHAFSGIDAARASAAEFSPALVLLGIDFLQQDGAAVLADLAVRLPETKLLLVAGSVHDRLATAALAWGGHDVLGKPITYEAVLGKVDALLGRQAARSARSAFHQPLTSSQRGGHADQL